MPLARSTREAVSIRIADERVERYLYRRRCSESHLFDGIAVLLRLMGTGAAGDKVALPWLRCWKATLTALLEREGCSRLRGNTVNAIDVLGWASVKIELMDCQNL